MLRCVDEWQFASSNNKMRVDELDFLLPPELIAQTPAPGRSDSRLLHYQISNRSITHRIFSDFPSLLRDGDLLVFNDAKVIPARFMLQKSTGGRIEGLFLKELAIGRWRVLLKSAGKATDFLFADDPSVAVKVSKAIAEGEYEIEVGTAEAAHDLLGRLGRMPLPPYIKREKNKDERDEADQARYQTVFARNPGSVAAPTAGLHFTPKVLEELDSRGIQRVHVTLHVGIGTFKPVSADRLEDHAMHSERFEIDEAAAVALNRAESENRRVVAVGTTACRVLESYPDRSWEAATGDTSIFIYPPYRWKRVGALLTNFHLPRSTLIALVAAKVGLDEQQRIYQTAIENRYRFFSYGDAMFIG